VIPGGGKSTDGKDRSAAGSSAHKEQWSGSHCRRRGGSWTLSGPILDRLNLAGGPSARPNQGARVHGQRRPGGSHRGRHTRARRDSRPSVATIANSALGKPAGQATPAEIVPALIAIERVGMHDGVGSRRATRRPMSPADRRLSGACSQTERARERQKLGDRWRSVRLRQECGARDVSTTLRFRPHCGIKPNPPAPRATA